MVGRTATYGTVKRKIRVFKNWPNRHPATVPCTRRFALEMNTFWTRVAENPSWRNRWAFQYATMPLCDPGIALSRWSQKWGQGLRPVSGASGADGGSSGPTLAAQSATKWLTGVVRCMVPFNFSRNVRIHVNELFFIHVSVHLYLVAAD